MEVSDAPCFIECNRACREGGTNNYGPWAFDGDWPLVTKTAITFAYGVQWRQVRWRWKEDIQGYNFVPKGPRPFRSLRWSKIVFKVGVRIWRFSTRVGRIWRQNLGPRWVPWPNSVAATWGRRKRIEKTWDNLDIWIELTRLNLTLTLFSTHPFIIVKTWRLAWELWRRKNLKNTSWAFSPLNSFIIYMLVLLMLNKMFRLLIAMCE